MAGYGRMKKLIELKFGEPMETVLPRLIEQHRTPPRVAAIVGAYPNAVRHWMLNNGYSYDFEQGKWIRQPEPA